MNKLYKFENGKRIKALLDIECPVCNKVFSPKTSKNIYCSRNCYYKMKRIRGDRVIWTDEMKKKVSKKMSGKNNWNYGNPRNIKGYKRPEISGEKHWNWKGGFSISPDGYKVIENENETKGERVLEHRLIMEKHLNRKLESDEIVHHINRNKLDNRIENLMLCTRTEHIKIHRKDLQAGIN